MKTKREVFNARGSRCPICRKDFRNGCNHSVSQAKERIEKDYINKLILKTKQNGTKQKVHKV